MEAATDHASSVTLVLWLCAFGWLATPAFPETPAPPEPSVLRYDEDWSSFRGLPVAYGWPGLLKDVPITCSDRWRLSFGGEIRERYERLGNPNWGADTEDSDGYLWSRLLPFVDATSQTHPARFFTQLNVAYATGVEPAPGPIDEDRADFLQLFADFGDPYATSDHRVRIGRQVVVFGSERLVGTRYGVNVLQSFDSAEATLVDGSRTLRLFYGHPTNVRLGEFDNRPSSNQSLWGAYATVDPDDRPGFDGYYLGFRDDEAVFQQAGGREIRHSLGARWFGDAVGWYWDLEAVYQFGAVGSEKISAWTAAINLGRVLDWLPLSPKFDLKFDVISGDRDTQDGVIGTFTPLFPSLKYFGESGVLAPYNLIDLHPTMTWKLADAVTVGGNIDFLWRYSTDDAIYGPAGRILRDGALSGQAYIATQYELFAQAEIAQGLNAFVSWTALPPGPFLRESGPSGTLHFAALELTWVF